MRLYIIGTMIGALGLVAANQIRAETHRVPAIDSASIASGGGSLPR